jgi:hypothetical protein
LNVEMMLDRISIFKGEFDELQIDLAPLVG